MHHLVELEGNQRRCLRTCSDRRFRIPAQGHLLKTWFNKLFNHVPCALLGYGILAEPPLGHNLVPEAIPLWSVFGGLPATAFDGLLMLVPPAFAAISPPTCLFLSLTLRSNRA